MTEIKGLTVEDLMALSDKATVLATASQWPLRDLLSQLPAEARDKALLYYDVYVARNPGIRARWGTPGEALMAAFPWYRTREGAAYWLDIYRQVTGTETITTSVSMPSSNSLTISNKKFGGFFEY